MTKEAAPASSNEEANANITVTDLENIIKIIDLAANDGAFKGWQTVIDVLNVRNKVAAFVEKSKSSQTVTPEKE